MGSLFLHNAAARTSERLGNNAFLLKEVLGHAKITTTEIYCKPQAPSLVMEIPEFEVLPPAHEYKGVVEKSGGRNKKPLIAERLKSNKINGGWYRT